MICIDQLSLTFFIFRDSDLLDDESLEAEHPEDVLTQPDFIAEIPELFIYVCCLGEHVTCDSGMPLQLEEISSVGAEAFELPIVPDHADLVDEEYRPGIDGHASVKTLRINLKCSWNLYRAIYFSTFFYIA